MPFCIHGCPRTREKEERLPAVIGDVTRISQKSIKRTKDAIRALLKSWISGCSWLVVKRVSCEESGESRRVETRRREDATLERCVKTRTWMARRWQNHNARVNIHTCWLRRLLTHLVSMVWQCISTLFFLQLNVWIYVESTICFRC